MKTTASTDYTLIIALFLRLLALIYFAAFASIATQIEGLVGSQGILPIEHLLDRLYQNLGSTAYWQFPSILWLNSQDWFLTAMAISGCVFSILLFFNKFSRTSLFCLLILYISITHAGQTFLNFQWDYLLIETGFLALLLFIQPHWSIWLFRWLLFRLRFLSGVSKLISQDPSWAGLTAVGYYFEVQPLPTALAWYAHHWPSWLHSFGAGLTLFIEIIVPFMLFLPRRYRFIAAWLTIGLQLIIIATSNHNWINLLTIVLCLFLFDDQALRRVLPQRLANWLLSTTPLNSTIAWQQNLRHGVFIGITSIIVFVSGHQIFEMFSQQQLTKDQVNPVVRTVEKLYLVNQYHVFPTMKTERFELVISGSLDGENWQPYDFKYKPDDLSERPNFIIPHQPRLDWMMWFVTLHPRFMGWFEQFLQSLLDASPPVLALLANNPFPTQAPNYLKVDLYRYHFADKTDKHHWWQREHLGVFPPLPYMSRTHYDQ